MEFAKLLRNCMRQTDFVGRWGGEEFLIILPRTDADTLATTSEKVRRRVEKHRFTRIRAKTASFGGTVFKRGDTPETLIYRADEALYRAKASGRNSTKIG